MSRKQSTPKSPPDPPSPAALDRTPPPGSDPGGALVDLARRAVRDWVTRDRMLEPSDLGKLVDEPARGVFVCIKRAGRLRGCIGSVEPVTLSLGEEVVRSAIQAATVDPRFAPVAAAELEDLSYQVDVLSPIEPVAGESELNPAHYGVVVVAGERRGLLLPGLEGVDDVETQLAIARQKAGIMPGDPADISRFSVTRFSESPGA